MFFILVLAVLPRMETSQASMFSCFLKIFFSLYVNKAIAAGADVAHDRP